MFYYNFFKICALVLLVSVNRNSCNEINGIDVVLDWIENIAPDWAYREKLPIYIAHKYISLPIEEGLLKSFHGDDPFPCLISIPSFAIGYRIYPLNYYLALLRIFYAITMAELELLRYYTYGDPFVRRWELLDGHYVSVLSVENEIRTIELAEARLTDLLSNDHFVDQDDAILRQYLQALKLSLQVISQSVSIINDLHCNHNITAELFTYFKTNESEIFKLAMESNLVSALLASYIVSNVVPYFDLHCNERELLGNVTVIATASTQYSSISHRLAVTQVDDFSQVRMVDGITLFRRKKFLFWAIQNKSEEDIQKFINQRDGQGAFSSIDMTCLSDGGDCHVWRHTACNYNSVILSAGLAVLHSINPFPPPDTSSPPYWVDMDSIAEAAENSKEKLHLFLADVKAKRRILPFARSEQCPQRWRALSFGLGSGEMHMFLLDKFPCFEVVSVEVNADVLALSEAHMGLENSICLVTELQIFTNVSSSFSSPLTKMKTLRSLAEPSDNGSDSGVGFGSSCRSKVVIADASEYIKYSAERFANQAFREAAIGSKGSIEEESEDSDDSQYFDLIVFDVFADSSSWNGSVNEGVSNVLPSLEASPDASSFQSSIESSLETTLQAVRKLLRPRRGLALFHLHRDSSYERFFAVIEAVFGKEQIVLFTVMANDRVVAAANDAFYSTEIKSFALPHPCRSAVDFSDYVLQFSLDYGYTAKMAYDAQFALNCNSF